MTTKPGCDCLNDCGDDNRLLLGTVEMCAKRKAFLATAKGSTQPIEIKLVHVNNNQQSLSQSLMDELKQLCFKPEYDNMTLNTLIGVLEMVKFEMIKREET